MYHISVVKFWYITIIQLKNMSIMLFNKVRASTTRIMIYMACLYYIRWLFICGFATNHHIGTTTFILLNAVDICPMFVLYPGVSSEIPQIGDTQSNIPRGSLGISPSRRHTINYILEFSSAIPQMGEAQSIKRRVPREFPKQETNSHWKTTKFIQR